MSVQLYLSQPWAKQDIWGYSSHWTWGGRAFFWGCSFQNPPYHGSTQMASSVLKITPDLLCFCASRRFLQGEKGAGLYFSKCDSRLSRIRIPKPVWGLGVLVSLVGLVSYFSFAAFRDWAKLQGSLFPQACSHKASSTCQKVCQECGNPQGKKKKVDHTSLQLLCQLVKKINPMDNSHKRKWIHFRRDRALLKFLWICDESRFHIVRYEIRPLRRVWRTGSSITTAGIGVQKRF